MIGEERLPPGAGRAPPWQWHTHGATGRLAVRLVAGVAAVVGAVGWAGPATAAAPEGVSMPYRCSVERGQVRMQRGAQRTYRIVGTRELQTVTLCSGARSETCHTIPIHRFALDCGGTLIPWVQASAVMTGGHPWRTSVAGGRMTLHPQRLGLDRNRMGSIVLPPGFAPAPVSSLRFAPLDAAVSPQADVPRPSARPAAPSVSEATFRRPPPVGGLAAAGGLAGDTDAPVGPPLTTGQADAGTGDQKPPTQIGAGWTASVNKLDEVRPSSSWPISAAGGAPGLMAGLAIAALLLSATAVAARNRLAVRIPVAAPTPEPVSAAPEVPPPLPAEPTPEMAMPPPSPPPPPAARSVVASLQATDETLAFEPTSPAWAQLAEMRATAEALLELDRQIVADHVPDGALREVLLADLISIALRLDAPELIDARNAGRLDLVQPVYTQAIVDLERARTLARIEHERQLEATGDPDRSLATIEEACAFLGVNPRASETVVKKVVDALRQNWHPDLASDDADRHAREARIKHINAAWDLIRTRA